MSWVLASLTAVATLYSAAADFTGMTDLEVLMHKDRNAALAEFAERAKDYPPEKIREIEQEYKQLRSTPRARPEPTLEDLLACLQSRDDVVDRGEAFQAIKERYDRADPSGKLAIRGAYVEAWSTVPYPVPAEDETGEEVYNRSRFDFFLSKLGHFVESEADYLRIADEQLSRVPMPFRRRLLVKNLSLAPLRLGPLAATRAEQIFHDMRAERETPFVNDLEYMLIQQIHRTLGRSGKPGLEALERLDTMTFDYGIQALGLNRTMESTAILWDLFDDMPEDHTQRRLLVLRQLARKNGPPEEKATRRERVREELVPYLQLPEGAVNIRELQYAVALAKDTKDPYYLPHLKALEEAFFALDRSEYHCPGMDDRMDEVLAGLHERFEEAKARLEQVAAAGAPEE